MKYRTIALIMLLFVCLSSIAQERRGDHEGKGRKMREKIEAQKVSYLTQQLSLTPEEAQMFWPLYNELNKKKDVYRDRARTLFHKLRHDKDSLTDEELTKISDELVEIRINDANLDKEYHYKYKKILPARKILELYHSERKFQKMLLNRIKERGGPHR